MTTPSNFSKQKGNKSHKLSVLKIKINRFNTSFVVMLAIGLVLLGTYSCASFKKASYVNNKLDFDQYKSLAYFGWSKGSGSLINDAERTRIEKAFGAEFRGRGIEIKTLADEYDLVVSLFIIFDKTTTVTAYNSHYGAGMYNGQVGFGSGFGYGYFGTTYSENDHVEGTLIIDVIDAKTKELIWQGVEKGFVDPNPANREKNLPKTVAKIMSSYPIKKIK